MRLRFFRYMGLVLHSRRTPRPRMPSPVWSMRCRSVTASAQATGRPGADARRKSDPASARRPLTGASSATPRAFANLIGIQMRLQFFSDSVGRRGWRKGAAARLERRRGRDRLAQRRDLEPRRGGHGLAPRRVRDAADDRLDRRVATPVRPQHGTRDTGYAVRIEEL